MFLTTALLKMRYIFITIIAQKFLKLKLEIYLPDHYHYNIIARPANNPTPPPKKTKKKTKNKKQKKQKNKKQKKQQIKTLTTKKT